MSSNSSMFPDSFGPFVIIGFLGLIVLPFLLMGLSLLVIGVKDIYKNGLSVRRVFMVVAGGVFLLFLGWLVVPSL